MRSRRCVAAAVVAVFFLASAAAAAALPCRIQTFEGSRFVVCPYAPTEDRLQLIWAGPRGPLGSFEGLRNALGPRAASVEFAMNAGMYETDLSPLGLFVVDGQTVRPINLRSGAGNFYLKPNGVFWVDRSGAPHVDESETFAAKSPHARWATQSGPLLVWNSQFNPQISPNGASQLIRNGVGVHGEEADFVISQDPVSLGRFARFFRDALGCPDALFLDGSVSSLWAPVLGREDARDGLGTFVVVLERRRRRQRGP